MPDTVVHDAGSSCGPSEGGFDRWPRGQAGEDGTGRLPRRLIKDAHPPDFIWPHLVVRTHDGVTDYCGAVKTTGVAGRLENNKYYAQIRFDGSGKIAKVDVKSVVKDKGDNIPGTVDSLCTQDGYSF